MWTLYDSSLASLPTSLLISLLTKSGYQIFPAKLELRLKFKL